MMSRSDLSRSEELGFVPGFAVEFGMSTRSHCSRNSSDSNRAVEAIDISDPCELSEQIKTTRVNG